MTALATLVDAGFAVSKTDSGGLFVAPRHGLNDDFRRFIRTHKAEILGELAANDSVDSAALAARYYCHHFACPLCIAAGQGYRDRCPTGKPLWEAYMAVH